jgi:Fe-S-cluster-containing dehydrogenase component
MHGRVLMVNQDKCDGCMLCVVACSVAHTGTIEAARSHIQVHRTPGGAYIPLSCHHCETASCVRACPTKACHLDEEGLAVVIDATRCIGCRTCVVACPFGHAHYDRVLRVSTKCDYCDGEPECARVCARGAIEYVYSEESSHTKRREAAAVRAIARRG